MSQTSHSYTCFHGHRRLVTGSLQAVALAVRWANDRDATRPVLIFDNDTGRSIDIDTRGAEDEMLDRLGGQAVIASQSEPEGAEGGSDEPRGRGRPKLGVVAREVTLLPRHWEWLAAQSGGASVALRKLVDEARRLHGDRDRARKAQERAYHFMSAMAGDMPGFEEASRALFANDASKFNALIATWPVDVRDHIMWLAYGDVEQAAD